MAIKQQVCCDFCGTTLDLVVPEVGISFGMSGEDFAFCEACLSNMTAIDFWKRMVEIHGLAWPLVRK